MKIFTQFLETILSFMDVIFGGISSLVNLFTKEDNRHHASFGDGSFLSRKNTGFNVNGQSLSATLSGRGLLISGESGSGKGVGALVKSCMTVDGSQIIFSPSYELFDLTSAIRSQTDKIMIFCPTHPNYSYGFNPMLRANTLAEINRLSYLLVSLFTKESESKSFWNTKSQELLSCLIILCKHLESEFHTLPNVALLLDNLASPSTRPYVDSLVMDVSDDWLFQKYKSITSQSDNVLQGVISSCQSILQFFDLDDEIQDLVSRDNIGDFEEFRKQRTTLYLISSTTKGDYFSPIMSIFLDQYLESFFARLPDENDLDVYFHLDEAPLLKLENLDTICANIRKHNGKICLVAQDPWNQFKAIYGESKSKSILSNLKTKAYYSINLETAERLEKELGIFTYNDAHDEEKMKNRSLRTASELMIIPEDHCLITHTGSKPILVPFTPYYEEHPYSEYAKASPCEIIPINYSSVHPIPLKEMYPNALDHEI